MSDPNSTAEENRSPQASLLDQIVDPANLQRAWERVRANKGAPGFDGMSIKDFPKFAADHLPRIVAQIREGRYAPATVRRVWIPKPNGEKRPLGIPTVLDRVVQQAIAQALSPIFDVGFSEQSYGFRMGKQAHAAIEHLRVHSQQGYRWGVDCDLKSYFDTVNHELLMREIRKRISDKRVLKLIRKYLRAGVRHEDGTTEKSQAGVPQGGPLSPLLANIMLDPLDKLIESIGLPFARYADDFLILAKTKEDAQEAMSRVEEFLECHLRLLVNQDKRQVAPLKECSFLGFRIHGKKVQRTDNAAQRFRMRIREITSRSRGVSLSTIFTELRRYCTGWFHYFKIGLSYKELYDWDQWIRRRVRLCHWKQWKLPRKRRRELIQRGIAPERVKLATRSRKGYWRTAGNSLLQIALNNDYLKSQGLPSLRDLWLVFKYEDKAQL